MLSAAMTLSIAITGFGTAFTKKSLAARSTAAAVADHRCSDREDPKAIKAEALAARAERRADDSFISSKSHSLRKSRKRRFTPMALITLTVTNTNDAGPGSLRQAMLTSNIDGMPNQIAFNIPAADPGFDAGSGTFVIKPASLLPVLTEGGTTIDGTTQTSFGGDTNTSGPEIVINGSLAPAGGAFRIASANNAVIGLVINGFSAVAGDAVRILAPAATGNSVKGCYLGTDASGSAAVPNSGNGVSITAGANSNQVGGPNSADRNIISGNRAGINIIGTDTSTAGSNIVQGNYIGVDASGAALIGNTLNGISITGTTDNLIENNVSSGNGQNGVRIIGLPIFDSTETVIVSTNAASGNIVRGNRLGTNAAGTAAIPNAIDGVRLNSGAIANTIGGTTIEARNICSGNIAHGVHMDASRFKTDAFAGVANNVIQGNIIGADATGAAALANLLPGVIMFFGASDNLIGGTATGEGNIIAFNTGSAVDDGQGGTINIPGAGVAISFDPNFDDPGAPPDNPGVANDPVFGNRVSGNSIHSNDGLGIDLNLAGDGPDAEDGVTPNDVGDGDAGANGFQNFPVLSSVTPAAGNTIVTGTLNSSGNTTFSIELFSNSACDPSGFGEGQTYLGSVAVTTDVSGNASFTATITGTLGCKSVTATATDPSGNTSEFSNCIDQAPTVSCSVATSDLWPANHNLINVGLSIAASDNCGSPTVSVEVFSDEPDEAPTGDGNFSPDAKDLASGTLRLRAERNGGSDGRVYLIISSAMDTAGNITRCCTTVTVSKSQSAAAKASVAAQAAAAKAYCEANGTAPPGYVMVGVGPIIGPKQ